MHHIQSLLSLVRSFMNTSLPTKITRHSRSSLTYVGLFSTVRRILFWNCPTEHTLDLTSTHHNSNLNTKSFIKIMSKVSNTHIQNTLREQHSNKATNMSRYSHSSCSLLVNTIDCRTNSHGILASQAYIGLGYAAIIKKT